MEIEEKSRKGSYPTKGSVSGAVSHEPKVGFAKSNDQGPSFRS